MSVSSCPENGLLLLLRAAKILDQDDINNSSYNNDKWEHRSNPRTNYNENYSYNSSNNYSSQRRHVTTVRRAHLRTCMENLKEHLNFDNDVPRITMLTVLKKATATIQYLKQKNKCLESCEDSEKQRCAQLLKRRQVLRKKMEEKRNHSLRLQSWKERNRNCSECSIATTSSDDSEIDLRPGMRPNHAINAHLSNNANQIITAASGADRSISDTNFALHNSKRNQSPISPARVTSSSPLGVDAFDASSSDSGFEEITITSNGVISPTEPMGFCISEASQFASPFSNKICRAC